MAYPSVVTTYGAKSNGQVIDASHINSVQGDITAIENFVGTLSSAAGTLIYDIRASASDGGGHVQKANKGGTGQTAYTKGDVLVAQSSSVLSKLAIGSDNQVLTADSGQQVGVKWAGVANAEAIQNQQYTYARASVHSASVYGVVLNEAVSILSDGLGLVVKFPTANAGAAALTVNAQGPSSLTALIKNTSLGDLAANEIKASMIGILEFDSVSSVFQMQPNKGYTDNQITSVYTAVAGKKSFTNVSSVVYNGLAPNSSMAALNLSAGVGANRAIVLLKGYTAASQVMVFADESDGLVFAKVAATGGAAGGNFEASVTGYFTTKTNASGVINWSGQNGHAIITLEAYNILS